MWGSEAFARNVSFRMVDLNLRGLQWTSVREASVFSRLRTVLLGTGAERLAPVGTREVFHWTRPNAAFIINHTDYRHALRSPFIEVRTPEVKHRRKREAHTD